MNVSAVGSAATYSVQVHQARLAPTKAAQNPAVSAGAVDADGDHDGDTTKKAGLDLKM